MKNLNFNGFRPKIPRKNADLTHYTCASFPIVTACSQLQSKRVRFNNVSKVENGGQGGGVCICL